jgi:hypothetical protein
MCGWGVWMRAHSTSRRCRSSHRLGLHVLLDLITAAVPAAAE